MVRPLFKQESRAQARLLWEAAQRWCCPSIDARNNYKDKGTFKMQGPVCVSRRTAVCGLIARQLLAPRKTLGIQLQIKSGGQPKSVTAHQSTDKDGQKIAQE